MDYSKFVSKREKWLKLALLMAIVIMIIGALIFMGFNNKKEPEVIEVEIISEGSSNAWYVKYIIGGLILIILFLIFGKVKSEDNLETDFEVTNFIANEIKRNEGVTLRTSVDNVTVQKGGVDETYVEFADKQLTVLYKEGVGCTERYPGGTIKNVKKWKISDVIEMETARDRKSTRLNSSHQIISYAVFCLKTKTHPKPLSNYMPAATVINRRTL